MPKYQYCHAESGEVDTLIAELINTIEDHKPLLDAGIKINALFAYPDLDKYGRPKNDAIKVNRYKALACIKATSYKDRVKGMGDVELLVDALAWGEMNILQKKALLDHELTHIQIIVDDYDRPMKDNLGRPKITMRLHDAQFGWFESVAKRWGKHSGEQMQAEILFDKKGQYYWPLLYEATKTVREHYAAGMAEIEREAQRAAVAGAKAEPLAPGVVDAQ